MVKTELRTVWITSDGNTFLYKEDAMFHEEFIKGVENAEQE